MKIILSSRRHHYLAIFSIFLIMVALIAGMVSCVPGEYDLTIASTAGGDVIIPGEGTFTCLEGERVSLSAKPDEDYRFVRWTGDVPKNFRVRDPSPTIIVRGNYSITANFEKIPKYVLTISSTNGGSVKTPGEGNFIRDGDTDVDLVAEKDYGYRFVNWTGDVGKIADLNDSSTTIRMTGNYSITANFEEEDAVTLDDNLKEAIIRADRHITGPDIYPSDLEGLTSLKAEQLNITDLSGLEHCISLLIHDLEDNKISDLKIGLYYAPD